MSNIEHRIMNDEGLNALIAFFCFYFEIHYSVFGVHDSVNETLCHCDAAWSAASLSNDWFYFQFQFNESALSK